MLIFIFALIATLAFLGFLQDREIESLKRDTLEDIRSLRIRIMNETNASFRRDTRTRDELRRFQLQFSLLVDALGLRFDPEKTEEVHQGLQHEVKVTPAKFVKAARGGVVVPRTPVQNKN